MKKPLHKLLYKYTVKLLLDVISVKPLRKYIKNQIEEKQAKKLVKKLEENIPQNSVLIFQEQFYDLDGINCYNGGAERYVQDLANILEEENYTPILIQKANKTPWEKQFGNLKIIAFPHKQYKLFIKNFTKYKLAIYSGMCNWGTTLLHPNIIISHGINWDTNDKDTNMKDIFNIFRDANNIVSVDTNTISYLRSTFSASFISKNMTYIPNYVDTKLYKPSSKQNDQLKIIFPRRASIERGYWLMSRVLPNILNKHKNVSFDFVGFTHGPEIANDIKRLVNLFPNRVNNYMVKPNEMVDVYQNADISVIPTIYAEGTSLSCLEAQACGNAVIATNIGGLPNLVIDGYNGVLINPDESELENAIDKVITDTNFRNYISKNATIIAQQFDKSIWIERWKKLIKSTAQYVDVKDNSVLIVEPNSYHGEILPGFVKYFQDLGYNVDLLVRKENEINDIFSHFANKPNFYTGDANELRNFLRQNFIKKYKYVFLSSSAYWENFKYIGSYLDFLGFVPNAQNGIFMIEHNIKPYLKKYKEEKYLRSKRLFSLSGFRNTPMLNPHYFGDKVEITTKSRETTRFVAVGAIQADAKNHNLLIDAVSKLAKEYNNFKITIVGSGMFDVPKEIEQYIECKGRISYQSMYKELEKSDWILPLLDYNVKSHKRYLKGTTTGSRQLSLGFLKPVIINNHFGKAYGYNTENSIIYKNNDLYEAMKKALELSSEEYLTMQSKLKRLADNVYKKSLDNLKRAIKHNA